MTHPLPEPDTHCWDDDTRKDVWSYSAEQMHAYAAEARQQALEDAARIVEANASASREPQSLIGQILLSQATAIRALMEKP